MGTGHGQHSKKPQHGASPTHVEQALKEAQEALRGVRKALALADTRFRQIAPQSMNKDQWIWEYQERIETALRQLSHLKTAIDRGLAVRPETAREAPGECGCRELDCEICYPPAIAKETVEEALREHEKKRPENRGGKVPKNF